MPPLPEIVEIAHRNAIPVIVDAAGQMPPAGNLRRFISKAPTSSPSPAARLSVVRRPPASLPVAAS